MSEDLLISLLDAKKQLQVITDAIVKEYKLQRKDFVVKPGSTFSFKERSPLRPAAFPGDDLMLRALTERETEKIEKLQKRLYAENKHRVLLIFQAMDAGGKDGAVQSLTRGLNPQGARVWAAKGPTPIERAHDPLWRVHSQVPANGEIVIFNRSQYEDVLVPPIHQWIGPELAKKRLEHIKQFERMLVDEGTLILKFFLHIDKDEQKKRLKARQNDPEKSWKLSPDDIKDRELWDKFMDTYQYLIRETSFDWAPWYIIPANQKKCRDWIVASIVRKHLEELNIQTPKPICDVSQLVIK